MPWGKRINAFGSKISEQHANCTPYPIRRQYRRRCALAEHCRPLAANLKVRYRGSPAEGIPLPEGGEQHWLEGTRRLQLDSLGGGHLRRQRTVQHLCSDPALVRIREKATGRGARSRCGRTSTPSDRWPYFMRGARLARLKGGASAMIGLGGDQKPRSAARPPMCRQRASEATARPGRRRSRGMQRSRGSRELRTDRRASGAEDFNDEVRDWCQGAFFALCSASAHIALPACDVSIQHLSWASSVAPWFWHKTHRPRRKD